MLRLAERFLPGEAIGLRANWVIELDGLPPYTIHVDEGRCLVSPGEPARAAARLTADPDTWLDLVDGRVDGIQAFQAGRLGVRGDLNLAIRLETLFTPGPESRRRIRTLHTTVRGVTIQSTVAGHGAPVLLLHGLAASKESFLPTLDDLARDHEVHAIDLPGFGASDRPTPIGTRYSPSWYARILRSYLAQHGLGPAFVVGNSMGGRIAAELALEYPDNVRGLIGLGSAVAFEEWERLAPVLRVLQFHWLGALPMPRVPVPVLERGIAAMFYDPGRLPEDNVHAGAVQARTYLRQRSYRLATLAAARQLATDRHDGNRGFWSRLVDLEVPSLWIWGRADRLVSARYAGRVADSLPHAEVVVWDDCGHVPQFEIPDRTHQTMRAFMQRIREESP